MLLYERKLLEVLDYAAPVGPAGFSSLTLSNNKFNYRITILVVTDLHKQDMLYTNRYYKHIQYLE